MNSAWVAGHSPSPSGILARFSASEQTIMPNSIPNRSCFTTIANGMNFPRFPCQRDSSPRFPDLAGSELASRLLSSPFVALCNKGTLFPTIGFYKGALNKKGQKGTTQEPSHRLGLHNGPFRGATESLAMLGGISDFMSSAPRPTSSSPLDSFREY